MTSDPGNPGFLKRHRPGKPFVGITVMPEYLQSETVDGVLDNLVEKAGATAVATSPYLMEPASGQDGSREPPDDAGAGKVRLLERPLWGKRDLWVRTAPSFEPSKTLYRGLRYQPPSPSSLTREPGHLLQEFIEKSRARGLRVYLQVQAAIPPGYRVQFGGPEGDDRPLLPDGSLPTRRLANNGSLASPHIQGYLRALIRDLCENYPQIDGIRLDWPEYPPYFLDDVFLDFSDHAGRAARKQGLDFDGIRRTVGDLYRKLQGQLADSDLIAWTGPEKGSSLLLRFLSERAGIGDWLRFKAMLVEQLLKKARQTLTEAGGRHMELMPNAFPPPWNLASGMDYRRAGAHSTAISVKLYTMHWPMMLRFYADSIRQANPQVSDALLVRALESWLDLVDDAGLASCDAYHYPETEEPHPVGFEAMSRKILRAQEEAGRTPILVLTHGYGPLEDFRKRLLAGQAAGRYGFWVNRYGYLSDPKLEAIREAVQLRRSSGSPP